MSEGSAQCLGRQGPLWPGPRSRARVVSNLAHEGGLPARVATRAGDAGLLGAWDDELTCQVGQRRASSVGTSDHHGVALQGRDDLPGPGGVAPAPVLLEPGVSPCLARSPQLGWGGQAVTT